MLELLLEGDVIRNESIYVCLRMILQAINPYNRNPSAYAAPHDSLQGFTSHEIAFISIAMTLLLAYIAFRVYKIWNKE